MLFHAVLHRIKYKCYGTVNTESLRLNKAFMKWTYRFLTAETGSGTKERDTDNSVPSHSQVIISATKKWIDLVVIGEELCPFVSPLKESESIRFVSSNATTAEQAIHNFEVEAKLLLKGLRKARSTKTKLSEETEGLLVHQSSELHQTTSAHLHRATLISFHGPFVTEFNDFDTLCELIYHNILIEKRFFDILEVMNFHPDYISYYDKRPPKINDSFYYPKRSPFPTMLLVPDSDMQSARRADKIEELCGRNKMKFVEQGLKKCQSRLRSCYDVEQRRK